MAVSGADRVSVVARNGIPVARTLDELAATSAYDGFTVLTTGGTADAAVTVAQMKAGLVPAGHEVHQPGSAAPHDGDDINDHFNPPVTYTGPLDIVAGAAVAYSVRALSAARLGQPLLTVGGVSYSADATTGDAPTISADSVSLWRDQSGNGRDVSQAIETARPQWVASFTGGKPGLDFSVSPDDPAVCVLSTASTISLTSGGFTCFAVCLMKDGLHGDELCGISYEDPGGGPGANNTWFAWELTVTNGETHYQFFIDVGDDVGPNDFRLTSRPGASAIALNTPILYDAKFDASAQDVRFNNKVQTIGTLSQDGGAVGTITGYFNIGADDTHNEMSECFWGTVAELIIYDSLLSDANRDAIRQNIATYYGITLS